MQHVYFSIMIALNPFRVPPACFLTMTALSFTMKGTVRQKTVTMPSAGNLTTIGTLQDLQRIDDILFVVYTIYEENHS